MKEKRNENKHVDPQIGKTVFLLYLRDIVSTIVFDLCSIYLIDHIEGHHHPNFIPYSWCPSVLLSRLISYYHTA